MRDGGDWVMMPLLIAAILTVSEASIAQTGGVIVGGNVRGGVGVERPTADPSSARLISPDEFRMLDVARRQQT